MLTSIIISSYNYAPYLKEAIDSALSQTHPHVEVLVIDDGSTDGSQAVIAGYGQRVQAVFKENRGQASAFNAGFERCRGDAILFLDSDDVLAPTAAECACQSLADSSPSKVHWPLWKIDKQGRKTGQITPESPLPFGDYRADLSKGWPSGYGWPPTTGNAWSRAFIQSIHPMPEAEFQTCPDLYLSILAPAFGPIHRIEHPQGCWRVHEENNTWREPLETRTRNMRSRLDRAFADLEAYGRRRHLDISRKIWQHAPWPVWLQTIQIAIGEIDALIPPQSPFILVDNGMWETGPTLSGRRCFPFVERDGRYWGPPPDDRTAIAELERLKTKAGHIAFVQPALWWLNHYQGLRDHLASTYRCIQKSHHLVAFDLQTRRKQ